MRQKNSAQCKLVARAARSRAGVSTSQVAHAMRVHTQFAARCFSEDGTGCQLSYADLFLLARAPETAGMVREMLAPLLELVDTRNLRLSDIDGLARSATSAHLALAMLRPTIERLVPLMNLADTGEVER